MSDDFPRSPEFSRRAFLKGASVVAAGGTGAVAVGATGVAQSATGSTVIPVGSHEIELMVNGAAHKLSVENRTTLLDSLRDGLDLIGTKKVCDRGACGGCTVLLDGETVNSCMMLAQDAIGHEVTTIEGVGSPDALHPMQQAFVECDALQCGFCTPGMVVSAIACVNRRGKPTAEQIRTDMSGNICRCGTYPRVFEAIERVGNGGGR